MLFAFNIKEISLVDIFDMSPIYLYNNIVLSMLYAEIYSKVRRHNARPEALNVFGDLKK